MGSLAHGDEVSSLPFEQQTPGSDGLGGEINVEATLLKILEESSEQIAPSEALKSASPVAVTSESVLGHVAGTSHDDRSKVSGYARLDFENNTFYVQTLQVILGRRSNDELMQGSHAVDVHISSKKAISRKHAKIFYNFGTQRFEISILGRNGAFVDDMFVEKGITLPLADGTKVQIGDIPFAFLLPSLDPPDNVTTPAKPFNPADAINLRSNLYSRSASHSPSTSNVSMNNSPSKRVQDDNQGLLTSLEQPGTPSTTVDSSVKPQVSKQPRMGKPAMPPRYGRPASLAVSSLPGVPAHLVQGGNALKVASGSYPGSSKPNGNRPVGPARSLAAPKGDKHHASGTAGVSENPQNGSQPGNSVTSSNTDPARNSIPGRKRNSRPTEFIPEQNRTRPAASLPSIIASVLREQPNTVSGVLNRIRELYPYYRYCGDGWQSSVSHSMALDPAFKKLAHQEDGWLWTVEGSFVDDNEHPTPKHQDSRAKETTARSGEQKLKKPAFNSHSQPHRPGSGKQKTIAELASEISRDTRTSYSGSIKEQLAANRSQSPLAEYERASSSGSTPSATPTGSGSPTMAPTNPTSSAAPTAAPTTSTDTKKALAYVQKELFTLYKTRNLHYDTATTTEIITKALTTTIAQVKVVGAKAGCGDNALGFLVERAPHQVSKILDIALGKSIREREQKRASSEPYPPAKR